MDIHKDNLFSYNAGYNGSTKSRYN